MQVPRNVFLMKNYRSITGASHKSQPIPKGKEVTKMFLDYVIFAYFGIEKLFQNSVPFSVELRNSGLSPTPALFQMFLFTYNHPQMAGPQEKAGAMNRIKGILREADFGGGAKAFPFSKEYGSWETDLVRLKSEEEGGNERVQLFIGPEVQCVFCFEICTPQGRGGENGGRANLRIKLTEPLSQEITPLYIGKT